MKNFILEKLKYYAGEFPESIALVYNSTDITYGQLDKITDYYAQEINKKIENKKNEPIVIYKQRNLEFIISIISVIKAHCYYIPLEIDTPLKRVINICNRVKPAAIICDNYMDKIKMECEHIKIKLTNTLNDDILNLKSHDIVDEIDNNDLVYMIFTSGTTGVPKGVKINYSNLYNLLQSLFDIVYNEFDSQINIGVLASFNFDASVKQIFGALYYGHTLVISGKEVKYFGRKIHQFHNDYNLALCDCTPTHLQLMILQKTKTTTRIPYLMVGGENLKWETLIQLKKKLGYAPIIINVYGPTECCVDVSYNYISNIVANKSGNVPIGIPVRNTKLLLYDERESVITKCNVLGELVVFGNQVGGGYFEGDERDFIKDENGCNIAYKTGDLAKYVAKDEIVILSRKDGQIKINGNRIELGEIETVISDYLRTPCVVLPRYSENKVSLVAYIYLSKVDKMDLNNYLISILPAYMLPSEYKVLSVWPVTQNGKLDLKKLDIIIGEYI